MILVTGGAGFIGSHFVLDWFDKNLNPNFHNQQIIVYDALTYAGNLQNLNAGCKEPNFVFIHGSIADRDLLAKTLYKYRPKWVINFAAESHVDRSIAGAGDFINTNIVGTFTLLEAVRTYFNSMIPGEETQSFRFLHVSTDEVYGSLSPNDPPFAETHQYQPNSPYSASKAASDHLVRAWHHTYGIPCLTSNCSNNYGGLQFPEKLIPLIIHNALRLKDLPIYGDGQQIRDWLFVKDHCSALRLILEKGKVGEVYNIGGNSEKTNLQVVNTICEKLDQIKPRADGKSYKTQIKFVKDRPGHDRRYAINATKLQRELQWKPSETFESGIEKTILWYLDEQNKTWLENVISGDYQNWIKQQYKCK